ncbi:sugar phosphate isomerase/epimerase [Aestuariibacter sp. GS-14]|uniref:sugar phosphate isomerase/epimerase family protein n=1 Tax=Aestuariibacter sp. GS-14 TaxID=2590670 RepID=UPI00112EE4A2|nr:sugar phosphate isomerase/epimerase family protein [Aestuariibacter sp. GS-14]TPV59172.1 sugar phosphate isomerase/epimerase [Aestuariibacter sp. GS-14]
MSLINIGVRAHDYGQGSVTEIAQRIGQYPINCVQLALPKSFPFISEQPGQISPGFGNYVRDVFARHDINIAVLGCYINPIHPDPEERERALQRFEEHLQFARDFGCAIVGTETGSRNADCTYHPDNHGQAAFDELVVSVKRLAGVAERHGVFVGIEGVAHHHTINTYERMNALLAEVNSPNVKVIYDPVNFFPLDACDDQQKLMDEAFDAFGEHIVAIHCKDFVKQNGQKTGDLPSGTGDMDHVHLFNLLKQKKPHVHVILESTNQQNVAQILRFVDAAQTQTD